MRACVIALAAVLTTATVASAQATRVPPRTIRPRTPSVFVNADGGLVLGGSNSYDLTLNANVEDAPFSIDLDGSAGPMFDLGAWFAITPRIGVGVAVSALNREGSGTVAGDVPHPFFFDQPRAIEGDLTELETRETDLHIDVMVPLRLRTMPTLRVVLFGGPSWLSVEQALLDTVTYEDAYPYDTATFQSATVTSAREQAVGFNAGVDFAKMLSPRVGIGGRVRYVGGTVDLPSADGDTLAFKVNNLQMTGGIRFAF